MKNLKKVIALVAVLAMVLSTVALGATYTDVAEDSAYSTAVESLSKLGIVTGYEDGTYGPEKSVTRAEMAALIARIQGYGETAKAQTNTAFADVPSSHWASGYVAYAANQNIVNGYGDGTFGPDDTVKYEQAVTMIMRTLGFEYFAATNGGYPTGYLAAAQRYGLVEGVSNAVVGSEANRGTIAQLLYNGIDTPIMAPYKWNTNGEVEYAVYDGVSNVYKTLMSENLGVIKIKGIVESNVVSDIAGVKSIELNKPAAVRVKIIDTFDSNHNKFVGYADETITSMEAKNVKESFLVGESDIDEFIGKRVVLYAIEDANTNKFVVVSAALDSTSNDTAEFTLDQYDSIDTTGATKNVIKYFKNATDKDATELSVEKDAIVVYNNEGGKALTDVFGSTVTNPCLFGGKATLIDNDSTSGYDVIFVEAGATAVVEEVAKGKVTFKNNAVLPAGGAFGYIKVNEEAEDEVFKFFKDGAEITVDELNEWDVLTIVASKKGAKYITAEVIGTPVTGAITSTRVSDTSAATGNLAYNIGGTFYDVAANAFEATDLQIGDAGTFYVDKYGKIAAFDENTAVEGVAAGNYGFVLYAAYETGGISDNVYKIKLLTANGVEIFDAASKVNYYYNGDTTRYTLDADSAFAVASGASHTKGTTAKFLANQFSLIKYTTNASGEINTIYEAGYNDDKFKSVRNVTSATAYDADNFSLGGILDEDATVFFLSTATGTAATTDASGYVNNNVITVGGTAYKINTSECAMGTLADLIDDEQYTAQVYLDNKGEDANVAVITSGWGTTAKSSNIAVITDVAEGLNEDYEDIYILSYMLNGELKENVTTTNTAYQNVSGLTAGDIVKLTVSSAGLVTDIDQYVNFTTDIRKANGGIDIVQIDHDGNPLTAKVDDVNLGVNGKETTVFGMASAFTKGTKAITVSGETFRLTSAANIYTINSTLKVGKVDVGAAGDYEWFGTDAVTPGISAVDEYADYVFMRIYDGRLEDVVIVKHIWEDAEAAAANAALATAKADVTSAKAAFKAKTTALTAAITVYNGDMTQTAGVAAAVADVATAKTAYDAAVAAVVVLEDTYADATDGAKIAADALVAAGITANGSTAIVAPTWAY